MSKTKNYYTLQSDEFTSPTVNNNFASQSQFLFELIPYRYKFQHSCITLSICISYDHHRFHFLYMNVYGFILSYNKT